MTNFEKIKNCRKEGTTNFNQLDGWINADYEQPNTARDVLVFKKGVGVSIGFFIDGWHMYGSNDFEIEVTYWRELPDPLSENAVWQILSRLVRLKTNENPKIH